MDSVIGIRFNFVKKKIEFLVNLISAGKNITIWKGVQEVAFQLVHEFSEAFYYLHQVFVDTEYVSYFEYPKSGKYAHHHEPEVVCGIRINPSFSHTEYLLKWKHFGHEHNSWTPVNSSFTVVVAPFKDALIHLENKLISFKHASLAELFSNVHPNGPANGPHNLGANVVIQLPQHVELNQPTVAAPLNNNQAPKAKPKRQRKSSSTPATKSKGVQHNEADLVNKPFKCSFCEFRAKRKGTVAQHELIHIGKKDFKCDQCNYQTFRKGNLLNHVRIHSDVKPFICDLCGQSYKQLPNLYNHKKAIHRLN